MILHRRFFYILLLMFLLPLSVSAQECSSDADCDDGWYCDQNEAFAVLCEEEDPADCPPEPLDGICAEMEEGNSIPPIFQCETDTDCPLYFNCHEEEICTGSADSTSPPKSDSKGEPGDGDSEDSSTPTDENIEETESCITMKACMYDPPTCDEETVCAEGFECTTAEEICFEPDGLPTQSDCACEPCADGEECPPCECDDLNPPDEEFCETLNSICEPKEIDCEVDSDCPTDWECFEMPKSTGIANDCICPTCIAGEECPPCDCDEDTEEIEAEETAKCIPPGWGELIEFILSTENEGGGDALPGCGNTTPPKDGENDDGEISETSPMDGEEIGGLNPENTGETPLDDPNEGEESAGQVGGCSATGANQTPMMVLGLMLTLMALVARRRQTN